MLTLEHLTFGFAGKILLDRVSLSLRPRAVTCLLGGNGSGKTTLFNLITGFLRPDAGSIRLGQAELTHCAPFRISRLGVARTFQDLRLIGRMTVRDNLLLAISGHAGDRLTFAFAPSRWRRTTNDANRTKADALLTDYFLSEFAHHLASDISYGQQKLLTLACCAAMDASLLLLDEPVAGISPEHRDQIARRIEALKVAGKSILLIEHQSDFLERAGDTFLYVHAGKIHQYPDYTTLRSASLSDSSLS